MFQKAPPEIRHFCFFVSGNPDAICFFFKLSNLLDDCDGGSVDDPGHAELGRLVVVPPAHVAGRTGGMQGCQIVFFLLI